MKENEKEFRPALQKLRVFLMTSMCAWNLIVITWIGYYLKNPSKQNFFYGMGMLSVVYIIVPTTLVFHRRFLFLYIQTQIRYRRLLNLF